MHYSKAYICNQMLLWQCEDPLVKMSVLKSLEIKGFIGGNRKNEIRNRWIAERRKKYII